MATDWKDCDIQSSIWKSVVQDPENMSSNFSTIGIILEIEYFKWKGKLSRYLEELYIKTDPEKENKW